MRPPRTCKWTVSIAAPATGDPPKENHAECGLEPSAGLAGQFQGPSPAYAPWMNPFRETWDHLCPSQPGSLLLAMSEKFPRKLHKRVVLSQVSGPHVDSHSKIKHEGNSGSTPGTLSFSPSSFVGRSFKVCLRPKRSTRFCCSER